MRVPTTLDDLLAELERGAVEPERYSRHSLLVRWEPMMLTAILAAVAIWSGMLLGGVRRRTEGRR
jgi:hypothetical protein